MSSQRLQKVLAEAGIISRRGAVTLLASGCVTVNGKKVWEPGLRVDLDRDRIAVGNHPLPPPQPKCTYLIDKPRGIICSSHDPQGRPNVIEWAHRHGAPRNLRLFSIGRLDYDSEGLLLLTTDGNLALHGAHPSQHVEKEYVVWLDRMPDASRMNALRHGVWNDGEFLQVISVQRGPIRNSLKMVLGEGRNRQIRRMMASISLRVLRLRRIRIGALTEADLKGGVLRLLPPDRYFLLHS